MNTRRSLALLLAVALLLACAPAMAETELEPITIKVLAPLEATTPNGIHDNAIVNRIKEKTGVTIDWINKDSISDWANYYGVMLASGDLPDLVTLQLTDDKYRGDIFAADAAIPLDDLVAQYGPNIQKNGGAMMDLMRAFKSNNNDGKLYFLGVGGDTKDMAFDYSEPWGSWFIRWDIYNQVGAPEIKTDEDLLNAMKLMQEAYPETEDGKKTYGLSGFFAESNQFGCWYPEANIDGAMGWMWVNCGPMFFNNNKENYVMPMTDDNSPWLRALRLHNKAFQMGLLDPESFTMTLTQYTEKVEAGRVLVPQTTWSGAKMFNASMTAAGKDDVGYAPFNYPYNIGQEIPGQAYAYYPGGWQCFFISKNCQYPERVIQLLDYTFSEEGMNLIYRGIEGEHWFEQDGKQVLAPDVLQGFQSDPDYPTKSGINKYHRLCAYAQTALNEKGVAYDLTKSKDTVIESMTPFWKDYCAQTGVEYPAQKWMEDIAPVDATFYSYISIGDDEDLIEIQSRVNTLMDIAAPQLSACKTDAEFDARWEQFKQDMTNVGYDRLYEKSKEALDNARAAYTPETGFN